MSKKKKQENKDVSDFYGYYDGIPEEIENMTIEELEEAIIKEKQKCDEMNRKQNK